MKTSFGDKIIALLQNRRQRKTKSHLHSYCLGVDVVGYSKRTTDIQCRIVQRIHSLVENSEALRRVKRRDVVFLPTGDGMIICLLGSDDPPSITVSLAIEIQKTLKESNKGLSEDEQIAVRIGIHSGTGASYMDINRSINIAGTVANMTQRVTGFGHDWHIVASKNAFDDIATLDRNIQKCFHNIGFGEAKHKVYIDLYNVYGEDFGNPENPIGVAPIPQEVATKQES